jgi:peptidoglycan LD-endopeptidase CwlK
VADVITRPTPPKDVDLESLFGDHPPDVMDRQLAEWVQSPQPWRKLSGVHPELRIRVWRIVMAMGVLGFRMMVTDGVRSDAEQAALYKKGRRGVKGEAIVTHCDGVTHRSNHQPRVAPSRFAGYAAAVDMTFVDADLKPSWEEHWPWELYGRVAKSQGLVWGGDWPTTKRDKPHVELFQ